MKKLLLSLFTLTLFVSCNPTKKVFDNPDNSFSEKCDGVPTLGWQEEISGGDAKSTIDKLASLVAAVKADAKTSKDVSANGNLDINLESKLARVINENVSKKSQVRQDFWEQENTITRMYCIYLNLLNRKDTPDSEKTGIRKEIKELLKWETQYLSNKKKVQG